VLQVIQRQHLIADKQRQHITGEGDPHGAGQGNRETDIEARLVRFPVTTHIADGIDGIDNPQTRRNQSKYQPERFGGERQAEARENFPQRQPTTTAAARKEVCNPQDVDEQRAGSG
jgi:hypothetical protein